MSKIKDLEVYWPKVDLARPVSNATHTIKQSGMVLVRVVSDDGLEGYGMTFNVPIAEYILKAVKPAVIGKDPLYVEDIWQAMYTAILVTCRKGLAILALSAVDIALWDLRGKMLGLPIHKLLGSSKRLIPTYCSCGWVSLPKDELAEEVRLRVSEGYKAIKMMVGVKDGLDIREDARRVEAVRNAVGDDIEIFMDANQVWDASQAIRFAKMVEEYNVGIFEEPVTADDIPGLRRVREMTTIPIATGGSEYTRWGVRDLLSGDAADVVQLDVTKAGGITEYQKISAYVQAWNHRVAPHAWEFISAHVLSPVYGPNLGYCEKLPIQEDIFKRVMIDYVIPKNGFYEIPDRPGLGYEIDMDFVRKNDSRLA